MQRLRVSLFKSSAQPFCDMLHEAHIEFSELRPPRGVILAAPSFIEIAYGTGAMLAPIATVLIAWIRSKSSRRVILTTKDNKVVHSFEGMSVEEVARILEISNRIDVVDTNSDSAS